MNQVIIDAHIHLDLYDTDKQEIILKDMAKYGLEALVTVSMHLRSAKENLELAQSNRNIKPAFGFHPEQPLPKEIEIIDLQRFIVEHSETMVAIGEVGLPYYERQKNSAMQFEGYVQLLESFIQKAGVLNKPIILHAVYDDAPIVCDLLERYSIVDALFHWFKGDQKTIERMIRNNYFISITPDVLYEKEIRQLVKLYPLSRMMVETDGPWPFKGLFKQQWTHPKMIHMAVREIAIIKKMDVRKVYRTLLENTKKFFRLP